MVRVGVDLEQYQPEEKFIILTTDVDLRCQNSNCIGIANDIHTLKNLLSNDYQLLLFDGNFVKNIFKIRDMSQEILKVCQNFNLGELAEKINTLLENLIYGIGEFNSLYIHHYDLINSL